MSFNNIEDVKNWIVGRGVSGNSSQKVLIRLVEVVYDLGVDHGYEDGHTDGYRECLQENVHGSSQ